MAFMLDSFVFILIGFLLLAIGLLCNRMTALIFTGILAIVPFVTNSWNLSRHLMINLFCLFHGCKRIVLHRKYDICGNAACVVDLGNAAVYLALAVVLALLAAKEIIFNGMGKRMRADTTRVENLSKTFSGRSILNKVSFSCKEGEIIGFVGYNGCGKSVLFKCICGFLKPDSGEIHIRLSDGEKNICGNAGIIIEEPAFLRNKSGMKNLEFLYGIRNKSNRRYLEEIMSKLGWSSNNRKSVGHYSLECARDLPLLRRLWKIRLF